MKSDGGRRGGGIGLAAAALGAALLMGGCRDGRSADSIRLSCVFLPNPPKTGTAEVRVTLVGADNRPITNATVNLRGDLAHNGMVPAYGHTKEVGNGSYEGSIDFSMAGDWVLVVGVMEPGRSEVDKFTLVKVIDGSVENGLGQGGKPSAAPNNDAQHGFLQA